MTEDNSIFLIAGLGNPGREYRSNRHNIGFMLADRLAVRLNLAFSRLESKALVIKTEYNANKLLIVKPQTYMNRSYQSIAPLLRYYRVPLDHLLIVYDDVDLPFGTLRLRLEGGAGGHKGMISIIEKLGRQDFPRMRIGIDRPPGRMDAADYVLQDFTALENSLLPAILDNGVDAVFTFITEGLESAMNKYNKPLDTDTVP